MQREDPSEKISKFSLQPIQTDEVIDPLNLMPYEREIILHLSRTLSSPDDKHPQRITLQKTGKLKKQYYQLNMPSRHVHGLDASLTIAFTRNITIHPTTIINPDQLTGKTTKLLKYLLANYVHLSVINTKDCVTDQPKLFLVVLPADNKAKTVQVQLVQLTHPLVRYQRKKNVDEYRYAICSKNPLGSGGLGTTFLSRQTIKCIDNSYGSHDIVCKDIKNDMTKWRVIKQLHLPVDKNEVVKRIGISPQLDRAEQNDLIIDEIKFLSRMSIFHVKDPILAAHDESPALVMRYISGSDLFDILELDDTPTGIFTIQQRLQLTIMITEAIIFQVHENHIIHRDIKPENIMVKLDKHNNPTFVTIIDFGVSIDSRNKRRSILGGTMEYISPEVLDGKQACELSDAYSFSVMLRDNLWNSLYQDKYNPLTAKQRGKIVNVILRGAETNIKDRISLPEILVMLRELSDELKIDSPCLSRQNSFKL